jgi:type IV secretion system protein VirD4
MTPLKRSPRTDNFALCLFLYIPVVWAALLLAQSLGGGLADVLANLAVALEHPFQIRWTEHSLVTILLCTGVL